MKIFNRKSLAALMVMAIAVTLIALPTMGSDSEHETLSIASIEAKILNDNVAVQRAKAISDTIIQIDLVQAVTSGLDLFVTIDTNTLGHIMSSVCGNPRTKRVHWRQRSLG